MPVIRTGYTQVNTGNYSGVKIQMLARLELRIFRMVAKWEYTFYNYNDWNVYKRGFFKVRIKNKSIYRALYSYLFLFAYLLSTTDFPYPQSQHISYNLFHLFQRIVNIISSVPSLLIYEDSNIL